MMRALNEDLAGIGVGGFGSCRQTRLAWQDADSANNASITADEGNGGSDADTQVEHAEAKSLPDWTQYEWCG